MTPPKPRFGRIYYYVFFGVTLCATIAGFVLFIQHYDHFNQLQPHSYIGLFFISFLAAAPIPVFFPNAVIVFMLGSLLNPFLVGIVSGLGITAGTTIIYYMGHAGKHLFSTLYDSDSMPFTGFLRRMLNRVRESRIYHHGRRNQLLILFIVACLPSPLLAPMMLSLGAARVSPWKVIGITFAGQTLLGIFLAGIGHIGLRSILDIFGIINGS